MSKVRRIYVEKKEPYAVAARQLRDDIIGFLAVKGLTGVRKLIRYDVENVSDEVFETACRTVFSEPPVDILYRETIDVPANGHVFSVEALPGQFDQRADSAVQCVQFLNENEQPVIRTAETYILLGDITEEELERIKHYCINLNPVDSRETGMEKPETLQMDYPEAEDVKVMTGMISMNETDLMDLYASLGLAMTPNDFKFIQDYFAGTEHRDPTITEIRVLDTYWSDHCRHTTFSTELQDVEFEDGYYRDIIEPTYFSYLDTREEFYKDRDDKYVCLMDLAIMGMKKLKADGKLNDQEESDSYLPWRSDPRPALRKRLCISGNARDRRGRSHSSCFRDSREQTSPEEACHRCRKGLLQLRKPDRPCDGTCKRDLPSRLCR